MKEVFIMNCVRLLKQNLFTTQVVELENVYREEGRVRLKEVLLTDKRFPHFLQNPRRISCIQGCFLHL